MPCFTAPVCRLGLATRGDHRLSGADVERVLACGINFLNWCGRPDSLSRTIAALGPRRAEVMICTQFEARTAADAEAELNRQLRELNTPSIDVLTFYYVEAASEWEEIAGPGGALSYCRQAQREGKIRFLGLTSHQRPLAATIAASGDLDALMIRYNAAHRGAEREIFPVTDRLKVPIIAYTCLRWGALMQPTPDAPEGFSVPGASDWYRFVLQSSSVAVALFAPETREELEEDLTVMKSSPLSGEEYAKLAAHGERVRRHGGRFP